MTADQPGWRERVADLLTHGAISTVRRALTTTGARMAAAEDALAASPDIRARITLGAVLARARVDTDGIARIEVPARVLDYWRAEHRLIGDIEVGRYDVVEQIKADIVARRGAAPATDDEDLAEVAR